MHARLAVAESTLARLDAQVSEDHERLRKMGEQLAGMDAKLDTLLEGAKGAKATEDRLRALEDWRTGLKAQFAVITIVASVVSAICTAVAIKVIDRALLPQPPIVSPIAPSREDARHLYLP